VRAAIAAALAALGLAVMVAGQASAQANITEAQKQELYCVHNALIARNQTALVAESYLSETTADGVRGAADSAINSAAAGCSQKHGWDDTARGLALAVGVMGSTADHIAGELNDAGVVDATLAKVSDLMRGLSARDNELLFDGAWEDDRSFMARIRTKLIAVGVPDKAETIRLAVMLLECSVIGSESAGAFIEERFS